MRTYREAESVLNKSGNGLQFPRGTNVLAALPRVVILTLIFIGIPSLRASVSAQIICPATLTYGSAVDGYEIAPVNQSYKLNGAIMGWPADASTVTLCVRQVGTGAAVAKTFTVDPAKLLNVLPLSLGTNGKLAVFAISVAKAAVEAITPGDVDASGNVSGASIAFRPGALGRASVTNLSFEQAVGAETPPQVSGTFSTDTGAALSLKGDFKTSGAGSSFFLPAQWTFSDPFANEMPAQIPEPINLGTVEVGSSSIRPTFAAGTAPVIHLGPAQLTLTGVTLDLSSVPTTFLEGTFAMPAFLNQDIISAKIPISFTASGPRVSCAGSSLTPSSNAVDFGGALQLSNVQASFYCPPGSATSSALEVTAMVGLGSTVAPTASKPIDLLITSQGPALKGNPGPISFALYNNPAGYNGQILGIDYSVENVSLGYNATATAGPALVLSIGGKFKPLGLSGDQEHTVSLQLGTTTRVECLTATFNLPQGSFFNGAISTSCDSGYLTGLLLQKPTISLGTLTAPLQFNGNILIDKNGITIPNGAINNVDISSVIPGKTIQLFGISASADIFTLSVQPATPATTETVLLNIQGATATLPDWLANTKLTFSKPIVVDLATGKPITGHIAIETNQDQANRNQLNILGATLQLGSTSTCAAYIDPTANEVALCGKVFLPTFLQAQQPRFVASTATATPKLVEESVNADLDFDLRFSCARTESGSVGVCTAKTPSITIDPNSQRMKDAQMTAPGKSCTEPFDLAIVELCWGSLTLLDKDGQDVSGTSPTGFRVTGEIAPEGALAASQGDQWLVLESTFNSSGFSAATTKGSIRVHYSGSEADLSNVQLVLTPLQRSIHGALVVIPNSASENSLPKLYVSDIGLDLTRQSADQSWSYHLGFKPDLPRTGWSIVQFVASLFLAKWIVK